MDTQNQKTLLKDFNKLCNLFLERNFQKLETSTLLIGTHQDHKKMIQLLEDNPQMTEDEFLKKVKELLG